MHHTLGQGWHPPDLLWVNGTSLWAGPECLKWILKEGLCLRNADEEKLIAGAGAQMLKSSWVTLSVLVVVMFTLISWSEVPKACSYQWRPKQRGHSVTLPSLSPESLLHSVMGPRYPLLSFCYWCVWRASLLVLDILGRINSRWPSSLPCLIYIIPSSLTQLPSPPVCFPLKPE